MKLQIQMLKDGRHYYGEKRLKAFPHIWTHCNYLAHWIGLDWITYIIYSDTVET